MKKLVLLSILALLSAAALCAQIPETPAGRQFSAFLNALNGGDRATLQQFIEKNMTFINVDQALSIRQQSGGYDVKKVEESHDTRLVLLAQERSTHELVRISVDVAAAEPYAITGMLIRLTQPPPELAPPKLTADQIAAAQKGTPFRRFSAWLEAFNTGDRNRLSEFEKANFPSRNLDADMNFRRRTGGLELRGLEQATATRLTGFVEERDSDQFGRFSIEVDPAEPHLITKLGILAIPRPAGFPIPRLSEADTITALRAKLEKDAAADRFAGAVLLAKDGKVLFNAAYGLADREKKVPNKVDTRFRIGSMNKMFTATCILQLVQAGKIRLTDPMGKYVTDYPNPDVAAKVTIHHLLTHTGGTGDIFGPEFNSHRLELKTPNDYVALFGKRGLAFEPGSRWVYSNYGMILLGVVIERVTKQSYYDYVAEHVYKPAGMTLTGSEAESEVVPDRAIGYTKQRGGGDWSPNTDTLPYRGTSAGGGYSTVGDLLKFAQALGEHKLLTPKFTEMLVTGKVDAGAPDRKYAYGFEDTRKDGVRALGHSGGAPGISGDLRIFPKSGYVVAVLSNLDPPAAPQVTAFLEARLPL